MAPRDVPFPLPRSHLNPDVARTADGLLAEMVSELREVRGELEGLRKRNGNNRSGPPTAWAVIGPLVVAALGAAYGFLWAIDNRVGVAEVTLSALVERCTDHEKRIRDIEHAGLGGSDESD